MHRTQRLLNVLVMASLLAAALLSPSSVLASTPVEPDINLLQYQSGGHVLGFAPGKVYLAGLDHALTIEFVGGSNSAPVGVGERATNSPVLPLQKVTYSDAWQGVDVIYTPANGGMAESTYRVKPGGRVESIHLRYNVPVELQANGSLNAAFPNGTMNESAPVAWQEIDGQRVAVDVRFVQLGDQEMGFAVGQYDPSYALSIDPVYQ